MKVVELSMYLIRGMGSYSFLLCAFYLFGITRAVGEKVPKRLYVVYACFMAVTLFLLLGLESFVVSIDNGRSLRWMARWTLELPAGVVLGMLFILTVCAVICWEYLDQVIRAKLTSTDLQEGLDYMPDGICLSTRDGIPLLVNKKMQSISMRAFAEGIVNTEHLYQRMKTEDVQKGCRIEHKGEDVLLHLTDGSVWDMRRNILNIGHHTLWEYIAYDVTERYIKSKELEKRNAHLVVINEQMREYHKNIDAIISDKEILNAKIQIHDDIGRSLLALRTYLAQEDGNREALVDMWRFTIDLLRHEAVETGKESRMETLIKAAEAVDVKLDFQGDILEGSEMEKIIAVAIHECLTNTVRHAGGDILTIRTREMKKEVCVELTNNGKQPEHAIEEKGGLRALRSAVEMHGGVMETEFCPRFVLRIKLRKEYMSYE